MMQAGISVRICGSSRCFELMRIDAVAVCSGDLLVSEREQVAVHRITAGTRLKGHRKTVVLMGVRQPDNARFFPCQASWSKLWRLLPLCFWTRLRDSGQPGFMLIVRQRAKKRGPRPGQG